MKLLKNSMLFICVFAILFSLAACTPPTTEQKETTPTTPTAPTTPTNPTTPPDEPAKDGLSADGTYYQLTDEDGVVIRVPIGKPLQVDGEGEIVNQSAKARKRRAREQEEGNAIYVFSNLSVISFGYGPIKHPHTNKDLCDPNGNPYTAEEKQILVIQCTDELLNAVEPGSANAFYTYIFILDYEGDPAQVDPDNITSGNIAKLSFAAQGHLSYAGNTTYSYFEFSPDSVSVGTPYTTKVIDKLYDEFGNPGETVYRMDEQLNVKTASGMLTVILKSTYCMDDWKTVLQKYEYTYTADYELEKGTKYDANGWVTEEIFYEDGMSYKFIYRSYYDNGQLKECDISDKDGSRKEGYDEAGKLINISETIVTGPNSYKVYVNWTEADGFKMHFTAEYVNDKQIYRTYLYDDKTPAETQRWDESGKLILEEFYDQAGNVTNRGEYAYAADGSYTVTYLDGSIYHYDADGNFIKQE